jgi:hypothetical protein
LQCSFVFSVVVVPLWSIVGLSFVFRLRCLLLQEQVKIEVKLRAPPPIKCKRNSWCSVLHNYLPKVLGRLECIYLHPLFWAESHLFMRMVMVWYFVTVCWWHLSHSCCVSLDFAGTDIMVYLQSVIVEFCLQPHRNVCGSVSCYQLCLDWQDRGSSLL